MKKLLIAIVLIAIMAVTLFGCTSTPVQNTLTPAWNNYEKFTYVVTVKDSADTGSYVSEIQGFKNRDVKIGGYDYPSVSAYLLVNTLDIAGTVIKETVLFNAPVITEKLAPFASYREVIKDGTVTYTNVRYDTAAAVAYCKQGTFPVGSSDYSAEEKSVVLGTKAPYYDNAMLYALLRTSPASSWSFNVLNTNECTSLTLQVSGIATTAVNCEYAQNVGAQPVNVFLDGNLTGNPHTVYYATDKYTVDGFAIANAPLLIVEGDVTYSLKTIDAIAE